MDNKGRNISTNYIENKGNNKENIDVECSDFILDEKNDHQRIKSCVQPNEINIDLTDEKMIRNNSKNGIKAKERYSNSENNSEIHNNIRSTVRVSDCSENITDDSGERKVPYFQTNFETDAHNIEVRPIDHIIKNISINEE